MVAQAARSSQTLLQFYFSRAIIKWVLSVTPLVYWTSVHLARDNAYSIL